MMRAGLVSCALIVVAASAHAFTIHGTLENGTTGDKKLSAKVAVVKPSGGMLQEREVEARDGHFVVPDLDNNAPIYLLRVEYAGVSYNTPVQVDGQDKDVAVVVYERTTSWDGVHVNVPHLAATRSGDRLVLEQLYEITNESSPPRTISGDDAFFHLFLPADMESLTACFVASLGVPVDRTPMPTSTPGRFRIEYPIRPGVTRIGVAYTVPYTSERYTLVEKLYHAVDRVTIFAVDPEIKVSSTAHTLQPMESVHGMSAFAVTGLLKNSELVVTFEGGDPNFAGTGGDGGDAGDGKVVVIDSKSEPLSLFVIVALVFTFTGVIAFALRDRLDPLSDSKILRRHYDTLVARLARLDDLHAAEAIPNEAYRAAREDLLTKTAALAMRLRAQNTAPEPTVGADAGQAVPAAAPQPRTR